MMNDLDLMPQTEVNDMLCMKRIPCFSFLFGFSYVWALTLTWSIISFYKLFVKDTTGWTYHKFITYLVPQISESPKKELTLIWIEGLYAYCPPRIPPNQINHYIHALSHFNAKNWASIQKNSHNFHIQPSQSTPESGCENPNTTPIIANQVKKKSEEHKA